MIFINDLDLNPLLVKTDPGENTRYCEKRDINAVPDTLDEKIWQDIKDKIAKIEQLNASMMLKTPIEL